MDWVPGVLCARRASWITASLGGTTEQLAREALEVGGARGASSSRGTGDPSLERLSGVCIPLE